MGKVLIKEQLTISYICWFRGPGSFFCERRGWLERVRPLLYLCHIFNN